MSIRPTPWPSDHRSGETCFSGGRLTCLSAGRQRTKGGSALTRDGSNFRSSLRSSEHGKMSVSVGWGRRQKMPSLWGRVAALFCPLGAVPLVSSGRGDLFSRVRRTCLSVGRQRKKVVQHLRGLVVSSICHYDCALIGARKDCLRWFR